MPRKSKTLTNRQREVYEFIKRTIKAKGYCPTVREIGDAVSINSPNGVIGHLRALIKKGLITRQPHLSRSIQLVNQKESSSLIAGATISNNQFVPAENPSQTILEQVVPVNGANQFVTVTDNSFSDAKIIAGDVLVIRTDVPAREGQTVLATTKTGKLSLLKWGADAIKKIGQGNVEDSTQCLPVVGIAVGVLRAL
jgi:repressor LexA